MFDILADDAQDIVVMKSTQGSATEILLIRAFAWMWQGLSIFWVLPTESIRNRFVKNRFDQSVARTALYQSMIQEQSFQKDRAYNVGLKHFGPGAVAFVGSNSPSGFGEFPADVMVIDELDQCEQSLLPMAEERLSNSAYRFKFRTSQPSTDGFGMSSLYSESDRRVWVFKAECGHWIQPRWDKHVVRQIDGLKFEILDKRWNGMHGLDARLSCDICGKPIEDRFAPGIWDITNKTEPRHGYQISKLFSGRMTINEMLDRFNKGLTNPNLAQRFWNADMGVPYTAAGAKVQLADIERCIAQYAQSSSNGPCVVGIDVGAVLHVVIGEITADNKIKIVCIRTLEGQADLADLEMLLAKYRIVAGVIDEKPETRLSRRLAYRHKKWFMCRYVQGKRDIIDPKAKVVSVDRTSALDAVVEAINLSVLLLPADSMAIPDFCTHVTALTRLFDKEANGGEGAYNWVGDMADHYFHALGYMFVAKRLATLKG
jgi:hypothetical protein